MPKLIVALICAVVLTGCETAESPALTRDSDTKPDDSPAAAEEAATHIGAESLRAHIAHLASDEFGGRSPASAGDVAARRYLAEQLETLGFSPGAADGGWEQAFDLVGITAAVPQTWVFQSDDGPVEFAHWDEFIAGSGVQAEAAAIEDAEVVFVGYGIQAPEHGWDDFKGQDLSGKVLLMLNNDPDWSPDLFAGERRLYYGRWTYKFESAARQGALGAIIIHTDPSAGYPWQVPQTSWTGEQFELPAEDEPRLQIKGWLTEAAAARLAAAAGDDLGRLIESARSRDFQPVNLGLTTSLKLSNEIKRVQTANVLGLLPGSDEDLRDEVLIYSAHYDHLGIGAPNAEGDVIYNGALDNAAGVSQVLAIAEAFTKLPAPPRRSVLVAFVGAEEQGSLGSKYYASHPTFPPGRIAANINYDGGNIWGRTRDLTFIGFGKSSLDGIVERIAGQQGRIVKPDQFPDRGYYYRSDQFSFAKIGIPALYIDTGTDFIDRPPKWGTQQIEAFEANHYHQPSDEFDPGWNFEGMIEDARLGFLTGLTIGNSEQMPHWVPGDEFEAVRQQAIRDLTEG